jgi:hypothetical protein
LIEREIRFSIIFVAIPQHPPGSLCSFFGSFFASEQTIHHHHHHPHRSCLNSFIDICLSTIDRSLLIAEPNVLSPRSSRRQILFTIEHFCFHQTHPIDTCNFQPRLHSPRRVSFSRVSRFLCEHLGSTASKAIHYKLFIRKLSVACFKGLPLA